MASITAGIWCSYFVEYLEDKKIQKKISDSDNVLYINSTAGSQKRAWK